MPPSNFLDLTGKLFGRLTVLQRGPNGPNWRARWHCQCVCGNVVLVYGAHLKNGNTQSCGCLQQERVREVATSHGLTDTPEYGVWCTMKARCTNPNTAKYPLYGGRGIHVAWPSFEAFIQDMGPRPSPKHTIERLNTDGPYSRENCVWATQEVQQNNRRNNHRIVYQGQSFTLAQLARLLGIHHQTLADRLAMSEPIE
jgi:hypothetical protein